MANGKGGRPRNVAVPKAKKIKLSKAQKQYAKMIHSIEADLTKKQSTIEDLDKKLAKLSAERARLDGERQNLEGAKKNLEGILAQIPPPPQWTTFTKYVYEYHHHYHHHDHRPGPYPVYIGPWWQYYYGGNYIVYPSQSQLQLTGINVNPNLSIGGLTGGSFSGNAVDVTTVPCLPNSTIVSQSTPDNGMFMCHNSNLPSLTNSGLSLNSVASSVYETKPGQPGVTFTASVARANGAPTEYTKDDADMAASVTALQSYGFFDMGTPLVDAADLSVSDLVKTVAK